MESNFTFPLNRPESDTWKLKSEFLKRYHGIKGIKELLVLHLLSIVGRVRQARASFINNAERELCCGAFQVIFFTVSNMAATCVCC